MGEFPNRATQFKPGEVRNPNGHNQYTYRAEAEKHLDEWCKKHGRELIRVICDEAKRKEPWAAKLMLDRILPAVSKHEHEFIDDPTEVDLADTLAGVARQRRANGSGRSAEPETAEDAGS